MKRTWIVAAAAFVVFPCALPGQAAPALRLTRELRIDAAEHDLTPITSMTVAPNGAIAVMQNQDGLIRFFDASGAALGTFGRKGRGPGEFTNAGRFGWNGDTLVISETSTRRFTLVTPDRKLVKTVPWATAIIPPRGSAGNVASEGVSQARFSYSDGSQLVFSHFSDETPPPAWLGGGKPGSLYLRVDASGAQRHVHGWMPSSVGTCSVVVNGQGGSIELIRIPFCMVPTDDVSPDGSHLLLAYIEPGKTNEYRVALVRASGDSAFARTIAYRPQPVPRNVRDSVSSVRQRSSSAAMRASADRIPEFYPPLARILAGRDATTWLEVYSASGDRTWHILDAKGNHTGTLTVPRNIQVMVASGTAIWGTETDDDGLQHIVRFRVSR
jgi:hypothetical protein